MRLFTAVELSAEAIEHLRRLQEAMRPMVPGVRWTAPGNLHITLKFLGETPDAQVPDLCQALQSVAVEAMALRVDSFVCFPPRGPVRIIAGAVEGDVEALEGLFTQVEDAAAQLGFPREGRPYHPHITLARARNSVHAGVRQRLEQHRQKLDLPGPNFTTNGFTLFESRLSNAGSTYVPLFRKHI